MFETIITQRAPDHSLPFPLLTTQVFEDAYRETHGLPPRKRNAVLDMRGYANAHFDEHRATEEGAAVAAAATSAGGEMTATRREERANSDQHVEQEGQLAADPEVARILAELQTELDIDGSSNGSETEVGGEGEEEQEGEGEKKGEEEDTGEEIDDDDDGNEDSEAAGDDKRKATARGEQTSSSEDGSATALVEMQGIPRHVEHVEQQQRQQQHRQEEIILDVSRMKIDAPHHHHRHQLQRGGTRPRSAPSTCLSAGGFSRLSSRTSSSSHFARTVSQKLLQATKEMEQQRVTALANGGGGGEAPALQVRSGTPASAIAQSDGSICIVKQNAEALQVCVHD